MIPSRIRGLAAALFSIIIWSSTYLSTKILVRSFSAMAISLVRFTVGLAVLLLLAPPRKRRLCFKDELRFAAIGFVGFFLYYFIENLATKHTYASNVSVIVTSIPLLTSLAAPFFFREERFRLKYLVSFGLTTFGFILILSQSETTGGVSILGDLLAFCAAFIFAAYTLLLRSIPSGYSSLLVTRKSVFYGWFIILIVSAGSGHIPDLGQVMQSVNLVHFGFLGILASGFCFISWAYAVKKLGPVRTSQFIYLVPFITISLSVVFLGESFTVLHGLGMVCILVAVIASQISFGDWSGQNDGVGIRG